MGIYHHFGRPARVLCWNKGCTYRLLLVSLGGPGLTSLLLTLALLQESLGNKDVILGGDLAGGMSETSVVRILIQEEKCS